MLTCSQSVKTELNVAGAKWWDKNTWKSREENTWPLAFNRPTSHMLFTRLTCITAVSHRRKGSLLHNYKSHNAFPGLTADEPDDHWMTEALKDCEYCGIQRQNVLHHISNVSLIVTLCFLLRRTLLCGTKLPTGATPPTSLLIWRWKSTGRRRLDAVQKTSRKPVLYDIKHGSTDGRLVRPHLRLLIRKLLNK